MGDYIYSLHATNHIVLMDASNSNTDCGEEQRVRERGIVDTDVSSVYVPTVDSRSYFSLLGGSGDCLLFPDNAFLITTEPFTNSDILKLHHQ